MGEKFFKSEKLERKAVPLKLEEPDFTLEVKRLKRLEFETEVFKKEYINEFKELIHFMEELGREIGKEYKFKEILIDTKLKKTFGTIEVSPIYPDILIISEEVLKNYREAKKFTSKKPHLYKEFKTGIKEIILHEREHVLEGPAQKATHGLYDVEIEKQVHLQEITAKKEIDKEEIINKIALTELVVNILGDGVDKALSPEKKSNYIVSAVKNYFKYYFPFKFEVLELTEKEFQIYEEWRKEYEEWKKEKKERE